MLNQNNLLGDEVLEGGHVVGFGGEWTVGECACSLRFLGISADTNITLQDLALSITTLGILGADKTAEFLTYQNKKYVYRKGDQLKLFTAETIQTTPIRCATRKNKYMYIFKN